ncbi:plasmid stability protein StbB [Aliidongia dinghuensis]|uniref:Ribonuclease VapC n=1 Tax=Aliidongia dinghuensis TaxID=1867774 RepID=A0A8J2YWY6_9PROT|nr:type II toxin-antitoxin system VapC family toxin [Aliidongia dinghuensis]GGF31356.1 plasmid stability protein StbB [Aliidongia dinghuensis]
MILVDTNVVSETMRRMPDPRVVTWLDAQRREMLHLSTISLAELLLGIAVLPDGQRKRDLERALRERAVPLFGERLLGFDEAAAIAFADIVGRTRRAGFTIGMADGQIAATAAARGLIVATRDTGPFVAAGLPVINPWEG